MTYTFNPQNRNLTHGVELEFCLPNGDRGLHAVQQAYSASNLKGWIIKTDGSDGVHGEAASKVFADCETAYNSIKEICEFLEAQGATVSKDCGLHLHIGNAPLKSDITPEQFTINSINHTGSGFYTHHEMPFDDIVIKDVAIRYTLSSGFPNGAQACVAPSRRDTGSGTHLRGYNKWCRLSPLSALRAANDIEGLKAATGQGRTSYSRKYSAVNFLTHSNGTIEFRQHQGTLDVNKVWNWMRLLTGMFHHTLDNRITPATRTTVTATPQAAPFRAGGRIIDQYNLMRQAGGCTTQDIMLITGCSEGSVRRGVVEIRNRLEREGFPRMAVITHDQISNGHRYGDGTDRSGYEISLEMRKAGQPAAMMPDNSIGNASIWAGIHDDVYAYWQDRISALR